MANEHSLNSVCSYNSITNSVCLIGQIQMSTTVENCSRHAYVPSKLYQGVQIQLGSQMLTCGTQLTFINSNQLHRHLHKALSNASIHELFMYTANLYQRNIMYTRLCLILPEFEFIDRDTSFKSIVRTILYFAYNHLRSVEMKGRTIQFR